MNEVCQGELLIFFNLKKIHSEERFFASIQYLVSSIFLRRELSPLISLRTPTVFGLS